MNYFQEYEKLRKTNALITSGSIWEDCCGEVRILYKTKFTVFYTNIPTGGRNGYPLSKFKEHFHKVG